MSRKNKGFTITELIIIIAIVGVLGGAMLYNASSIFGFSARECYNKLGQKITSTKVDTLGKAKNTGDVYLRISKDEKERVLIEEVINGTSQGVQQISNRKLKLNVIESDGTITPIEYSPSGSSYYDIIYNRSTGAIVKNAAGDASTIDRIEISVGSHLYTIKLYPATGKISY